MHFLKAQIKATEQQHEEMVKKVKDMKLSFIKVLSTLPTVDMLQLVRNMQQAITIRVVEFGDDDEESVVSRKLGASYR